jgi:signal transduction histidine kinase
MRYLKPTLIQTNCKQRGDFLQLSSFINRPLNEWHNLETYPYFKSDPVQFDGAYVLADGGMMVRALVNLLTNAIRYSPSDSVV